MLIPERFKLLVACEDLACVFVELDGLGLNLLPGADGLGRDGLLLLTFQTAVFPRLRS